MAQSNINVDVQEGVPCLLVQSGEINLKIDLVAEACITLATLLLMAARQAGLHSPS